MEQAKQLIRPYSKETKLVLLVRQTRMEHTAPAEYQINPKTVNKFSPKCVAEKPEMNPVFFFALQEMVHGNESLTEALAFLFFFSFLSVKGNR